MPFLKLISLVCHTTEDITPPWKPTDDPFIRVNGVEIWRGRIHSGESLKLAGDKQLLPFTGTSRIDLYEYDSPDPTDHLGTDFVWDRQAGSGPLPLNFNGRWHGYTIYCEVLPDGPRHSSSKMGAKGDDGGQIETILRANLGKNFDLFFDTDVKRVQILREVANALDESELVETTGQFDRWKCARCIAINLALGIAVAAAIAAFGPASPGVVPYVMQAFGVSESVANAIVVVVKGGATGAKVAKKLCKDC